MIPSNNDIMLLWLHQLSSEAKSRGMAGDPRPSVLTSLEEESAMKFPRRKFLHLVASAAAVPAFSRIAWAQAYPARPVRLIVGFAAGGGTDLTARVIGQWLSDRLG